MAHLHDEIHLSCLSVASAVAKKMGKKWSASDFHWKNYFQKVKESWKAPKRTSWSPGGSIKQRFTWNPSRPDLFSSASRENQEIDVSAFKKNAQAAVAKVSSLRVHLDFPYISQGFTLRPWQAEAHDASHVCSVQRTWASDWNPPLPSLQTQPLGCWHSNSNHHAENLKFAKANHLY